MSLCKYGLPTEDLYEFAALSVLKHEKKLKAQKKRELEERLKQRNDQRNNLGAAKARGVSQNAAAAEDQGAPGVSPNIRGVRAGSKKRAPAGGSVEPPQMAKDKSEKMSSQQNISAREQREEELPQPEPVQMEPAQME